MKSNDKLNFVYLFDVSVSIENFFYTYGDVTIALTNPWHSPVAERLTVELSSPVLTTST